MYLRIGDSLKNGRDFMFFWNFEKRAYFLKICNNILKKWPLLFVYIIAALISFHFSSECSVLVISIPTSFCGQNFVVFLFVVFLFYCYQVLKN